MRNALLLPGAILLAGALLAVSIYVVRTGAVSEEPVKDLSLLRPLSLDEHILGSPDARVLVIEYADLDSPYAKQLQEVMTELMGEYGEDGRLAWVLRHFPVSHIYPDSPTHAHAAECVAALGGEEAFWGFIEAMHAEAPGAVRFPPAGYAPLLPRFGITQEAFADCMADARYEGKVGADALNALEIGASGSPHTVILPRGVEPFTVSGSLPYEAMKAVIDEALTRATP